MINPHIKHALADSPYNARRISCEKAATELDALLDHPVKALRDVSWEEFEAKKDQIDPEAARDAGALGARLSGGGWGGSVVALAHAADADSICKKIIETCQTKGLNPTPETIIPSEGGTDY